MRGTTPPNWQITTRRASDPGRNAQGTGCEGYAAWPNRARVTSSSVALRAPIRPGAGGPGDAGANGGGEQQKRANRAGCGGGRGANPKIWRNFPAKMQN